MRAAVGRVHGGCAGASSFPSPASGIGRRRACVLEQPKPSAGRSVFALRRRPRNARACTGSASRTPNPLAASSRPAHRQPVVTSIATAATRPRHSSAQRPRRSRSAVKRSSTTSPLSGSSTPA
jgi:hypothetical protein